MDLGSECRNPVFGSGFGGIGAIPLCKARVFVGWVGGLFVLAVSLPGRIHFLRQVLVGRNDLAK